MIRQLISYANGHLDRAGTYRKDPAWIADRLAQPESIIIPVWRNRNLIRGLNDQASSPTAVTTTRDSAAQIVEAASEMVFLGLDSDTPVFTADLSALEKEQALLLHGGQGGYNGTCQDAAAVEKVPEGEGYNQCILHPRFGDCC